MSTKLQALLASYARSVLSAGLALYLAGVTEPKDLLAALVAALAPVAIRFINPNDAAFGKLPTVEEVEVAVKSAKPSPKTPAKKVATKRTTVK